MDKYKIFGKHGEVITALYADSYEVLFTAMLVRFVKDNKNIAWFNLETIAGFKKSEE